MPSTAEINAQNEASRARQQANRGIVPQAPQQVQQQSPWINPYGTQYGTDSIQDQSYYDNYYNNDQPSPYVNPYGQQYGTDSIQDQSYYDNYYNDNSGDSMTDEEWFAYLAMLDEQSQQDSNYSSEYGSRMPDGPIDYAPSAPVVQRAEEPSIYDNMMKNLSESRFGKYLSGITTYDLNSGGNVVPGSGNREFPNLAERNQVPAFGSNIPQQAAQQTQQQALQLEPQSPFLQSLNMEQGSKGSPQSNYYDFVQGGGQINDEQLRQAKKMAMSMGTTFDPETGYSRTPIDTYGGGGGRTPNGENKWLAGGMRGGEDQPLQRHEWTEGNLNNPRVNNPEFLNDLTQRRDIESDGYWNTPMTGMRPIDPETGQPASQRLIDAAARAGVELPMASVPMPQEPQVQAPMSMSDTRGMLQERFGSPTVSGLSQSNQDSRNFYDEQSQLRMQRDENRPDFNSVTRDIDKYDNRRSFAEARKLVPTERDKYGNITNREEQRKAMILTDREVQDKERNEYNKEYRAKNLEKIQQTIDNGNKPNATKQEIKEAGVAEEIEYFFKENPNFPPEAIEALRRDGMGFTLPYGARSHLQLWADKNNYDLEELYQQSNQENNGEGGAAPVQQRGPTKPRPPTPAGEPRRGEIKMVAPNGKLMNVPEEFVKEMIAKGAKRA